MSDVKNPIVKVGLRFGFYGGLLSIASFVLFYFIDERPILTAKLLDLLIISLFIFFAVKEYKKYYNQNELLYWQGISVGLVTFITTSVVSSGFLFTFLTWVDPAVLDSLIQHREAYLIENKEELIEKISDEQYKETLKSIRSISAFNVAVDDMIKKSIIGMFGSALFAAILRKAPEGRLKPK